MFPISKWVSPHFFSRSMLIFGDLDTLWLGTKLRMRITHCLLRLISKKERQSHHSSCVSYHHSYFCIRNFSRYLHPILTGGIRLSKWTHHNHGSFLPTFEPNGILTAIASFHQRGCINTFDSFVLDIAPLYTARFTKFSTTSSNRRRPSRKRHLPCLISR